MRLAYNQKDAAEQLSLSVPTFRKRVRPQLKAVYVGRKTLYPATELQRWLDSESSGL